jgi:hypothetical protein
MARTFKASSRSQRQIVEAEAPLTPRSITSQCSSVREKRESGSPWLTDRPQASAFTSATCTVYFDPETGLAKATIELGKWRVANAAARAVGVRQLVDQLGEVMIPVAHLDRPEPGAQTDSSARCQRERSARDRTSMPA